MPIAQTHQTKTLAACNPSLLPNVARPFRALEHLGFKRRQLSVVASAQKAEVGPQAAATRSRKQGAGKEAVGPLPTSEDDLLLVPCAHLHAEQLERHDIYTASDFWRAYVREGANFRSFLQDKIEVRDEKQLVAMEAYCRTLASLSTSAAAAEAATTPSAAAAASSAPAAAPAAAIGMTCSQVTLSVEGNISAGKSTFLSILHRHLLHDAGFNFVKEPIERWQAVGGSSVNLLDLFYRDPARMAYTFQNFVFLTRVLQERESYGGAAKARILERSVFSDRMVFVRAMHASSHLADHELSIYDAWFGPILSSLPTLVPNGLIYLRASPATCMARLRRRARSEEGGIPLDYLQCLHENHEDWLLQAATRAVDLQERLRQTREGRQEGQQQECSASPSSSSGAATAIAATSAEAAAADPATSAALRSGGEASTSSRGAAAARQPPAAAAAAAAGRGLLLPLAEAPPPALAEVEVPPSIAPHLYIIDATKLPGVPSAGFLHQLPSLVVDCEPDVDVEADTGHGEAVSNLVRDYADFVSRYRAACHRLAASGHPAASGLRLPAPDTEYYTTDEQGRVTYRSHPASGSPGAGLGAASLPDRPAAPAPGQ